MSGPGDYEIGYKKPPLHTRFGAGSGNRRGRGRKSRNLKADLLDELAITVSVPGDPLKKMSRQRAIIRRMVNDGVKGDLRAGAKILELVLRVIGAEEGADQPRELTAEDQAILDNYLNHQRTSHEA